MIKKGILHILNLETQTFYPSMNTLDFSQPSTSEYVQKVMDKLVKSDVKSGSLPSDHLFFKTFSDEIQADNSLSDDTIKASQEQFAEQTAIFCQEWFNLLCQTEEGSNCDILCIEATNDNLEKLIAFIKLPHKHQYTHFMEHENEKVSNQLLLNQTILPPASQQIDEGILINLTKKIYQLIEKRYTIDGKKVAYFSNYFFPTPPAPTVKENIAVLKKVATKIGEKYQKSTPEVLAETQRAVYETIEKDGILDEEYIAEAVFKENPVAKNEYLSTISEKPQFQEKLAVNSQATFEKKYSKQKLKLDNGIELTIPIELYNNPQFIEFTNQPDGTISVILKNIDEITNKF